MSEVDRLHIAHHTQLNCRWNISQSRKKIFLSYTTLVILESALQQLSIRKKTMFLKYLVKLDILLPSNKRKGIDFDLLLNQQVKQISKPPCMKPAFLNSKLN